MITYRKNALRVHIVSAKDAFCTVDGCKCSKGAYTGGCTSRVAMGIKCFVEKGNYKRIAEIQIVGQKTFRTAIIIYEKSKD